MQVIGTVGQSLAQLVQAKEEAKGTEEQAAQKELEARRHSAKEHAPGRDNLSQPLCWHLFCCFG